MSTDWNIYCATCGETHHFNDANHMNLTMRALIKHAGALADLAPLFREPDTQLLQPPRIGSSWGTIDPWWFEKHRGHELVPRNEYGGFEDDCEVHFKCGKCGATERCGLPVNHPGDHAKERPLAGKAFRR